MTTIPTPNELMNRVLDSFVNAGGTDADFDAALGLIEPYDASAGVRADPATAWNEVQALAKLYEQTPRAGSIPPEWSGHAFADSTLVALPCALGYFPQQVNDIPRLLKTVRHNTVPKAPENRLTVPAREKLAKLAGEELLLGVGVARLAGAFDLARDLLNRCTGIEAWVRGNEVAATMWMKGDRAEALRIWKIQPANAVVLLNRGMAQLFLNQKDAAKKDLQAALPGLPEGSGWIHLAQLYLSLCEM